MNNINKLALGAVVLGLVAFTAPSMSYAKCMPGHGDGGMMKMEKASTHEAHYYHHYSDQAFKEAQMKGETILLTFHLDGCPMCAKQQVALNGLEKAGALDGIKVFAVDFGKNTEALKKFDVSMQGALILYKGDKKIVKKDMLTKVKDIKELIMMK